jgi:hypothetical protein
MGVLVGMGSRVEGGSPLGSVSDLTWRSFGDAE